MTKRMFLAGPFKSLVDSDTKTMQAADVAAYTSIIDHFEARGWNVHCAHKREGWGQDFMQPAECTSIDYAEIESCDVFVAFPGAPASPGTHIEIGWASAFGKPIVLLLEHDHEYAFLVRGLPAVARVEMLDITRGETLGERIETTVDAMLDEQVPR